MIIGKRTNEQFCEQLEKTNSSIKPLEEYSGAHQKILVKCLKCGNTFRSDASSLLKGHGCRVCAYNRLREAQRMPKDVFKTRLNIIQPNLILLSDYCNSFTKVKVKCKICGNEYVSFPSNLLSGYGCKQCYRNRHKPRTRKEFIDCVRKITNSIDVGEDYKDGKTPCTFYCSICGYERKVIPNLFLSKLCRCPKCDGTTKMTPQEYRDFVFQKNGSVSVITDYKGVKHKLEYSCVECGQRWIETPEIFAAREFRCKVCQRTTSRMENKINSCLKEAGVDFITQKKFVDLFGVGNGYLTYDFFVPSYNLLIEAQGEQHEKPIDYFGGEEAFAVQQEHDKRKRDYATSKKMTLLEIWYTDYDKIEDILSEYLCKFV